MFGSRLDLLRIIAALNADPFADPVCIGPVEVSRREARRCERELMRRFSSVEPSAVAQAGDVQQARAGHPLPEPRRSMADGAALPVRCAPSPQHRAGNFVDYGSHAEQQYSSKGR